MKDQKKWRTRASRPVRVTDLDLFSYSERIDRNPEGQVWDPVRQKWLLQTPEETVRLSLIYGLNDKFDVSFRRIASERRLKGHVDRRFDIVVFDKNGQPYLLVECKSPEHALRTEHIIQLGSYNEQLHAPYVMLTNGINTVLIDLKSNEFMASLSRCFPTNL